MRIAFIGLGNMGAPMARNLIKAGHQLNLFDLNKTVLAELAELARGQGVQLQRYRDGGLSDAVTFRFADGLSWRMGGEQGRMRSYQPQRDYLKLVSTGRRNAVADKFGLRLSHPWLWRWKDRIDRRFMAMFAAYPQMVDYPAHLARMHIMLNRDSSPFLQEYYGFYTNGGVLPPIEVSS